MKVSIIGGGGLVGSCAAFALQCGGIVREIAVLDVNADLFTAVAAPLWRLEAVESFPDRTAVLFALEPGHFEARRANTVSLYFDAHGRLLEAAHVVELRPD